MEIYSNHAVDRMIILQLHQQACLLDSHPRSGAAWTGEHGQVRPTHQCASSTLAFQQRPSNGPAAPQKRLSNAPVTLNPLLQSQVRGCRSLIRYPDGGGRPGKGLERVSRGFYIGKPLQNLPQFDPNQEPKSMEINGNLFKSCC